MGLAAMGTAAAAGLRGLGGRAAAGFPAPDFPQSAGLLGVVYGPDGCSDSRGNEGPGRATVPSGPGGALSQGLSLWGRRSVGEGWAGRAGCQPTVASAGVLHSPTYALVAAGWGRSVGQACSQPGDPSLVTAPPRLNQLLGGRSG